MSNDDHGSAPTLDWQVLVDHWVEERGTLSTLAEALAAQRSFEDDVASVERALRRLRKRGSLDGGIWGRRALRCFGLPKALSERVRWMGLYHSRFTDLPTGLCLELLRPWNRPPTSESPARAWVQLGFASVYLRLRQHELAAQHLDRVQPTMVAAQLEHALVSSYVLARLDPSASVAALDEAERLLPDVEHEDDAACFQSRLIDQRAYRLNKPTRGAPDHEAAYGLYASLPEVAPGFALCRRHNGLGWSSFKLGRTDEAIEHGEASLRIAGDVGSLRLRAMALNLLARATQDASYRTRAQSIAKRLEDQELLFRYGRT